MAGISSSFSRDLVNWTPKEFGLFQLSGNQTTDIAITDPIKFNTVVLNNMAFDPATYRVTLKANKTYCISSALYIFCSANTGYAQYRIYDVTNASLIGMTGTALISTYITNHGTQENIEHYITPSIDTVIEIRLYSINSLHTIYAIGSYLKIQEIETFAPSRAKWQYEYVSPLLDLTCSGPAGWATIRAVGIFYKTSNGAWKLNFNIVGAAGINTDFSVTVTGVTFKNVANNYQAISVGSVGGFITYNYATPNSSVVRCTYNANVTSIRVSGDVELDAKPTGYDIPSDV